jgi:5'(3')-deoxyribonucleotidase
MQTIAIAIDVDGVLVEQVIPTLQRIKEKYGISLSKEQITSWEFPIGNSDIKTEIELAEMEEKFVKLMPPIEGCIEALSELSQEFNIIIATGRKPITDSWTKDWLNSNKVQFDHFINTRESGKSISEAQFLIDDYDKNIKEFIKSGDNSRKAILFNQPWNNDHHLLMPLLLAKRVYIAEGWNQVLYHFRHSLLVEFQSY